MSEPTSSASPINHRHAGTRQLHEDVEEYCDEVAKCCGNIGFIIFKAFIAYLIICFMIISHLWEKIVADNYLWFTWTAVGGIALVLVLFSWFILRNVQTIRQGAETIEGNCIT
ncbi:hypothetical protein CMO96_02610 [Candidatus Woesebacteria bacterium]|nr:hypothetical protein [Candidatus Woesebacteria bacterium]|tara:strand:- start:431 stop:769 length:339 start_codon:yes stop_codon:yes gene_type:complete